MPTTHILCGVSIPLNQNEVYSLPSIPCVVTGGAVLQKSTLFGGPFADWPGSNSGIYHPGQGFVRCVSGASSILANRVKMKGPFSKGSYSRVVLDSNPSNYWRLDETSGLIAKDAVGGANGTISGGVTLNQPGISNDSKAMLFNGVDGKIATSVALALLTPFTFEAWVRRNSNVGSQVIFCNSFGVEDNILIRTEPNLFSVYTGYSGPALSFPYDTLWHHLIVVAPGNSAIKLYIDGQTTPSDPTLVTFITGVAKVFEIGFNPNWVGFNGSLAEVAIYPLALTAQQIAEHYAMRA